MDDSGKQISVWENGEIVTAVAYDAPVPGYGTKTTNNLRLWSSKASHGEFDFTKFNSGEYEASVDFTLPGTWTVRLTTRLSEFESPVVSTEVEIP